MRSATETCYYCGAEYPVYGMALVSVPTPDGRREVSSCVAHVEQTGEHLLATVRQRYPAFADEAGGLFAAVLRYP